MTHPTVHLILPSHAEAFVCLRGPPGVRDLPELPRGHWRFWRWVRGWF